MWRLHILKAEGLLRNCLLIASHAQADGRKNPICNRPRQETTGSCLPVTVEVHASIETCFCSSARPTSWCYYINYWEKALSHPKCFPSLVDDRASTLGVAVKPITPSFSPITDHHKLMLSLRHCSLKTFKDTSCLPHCPKGAGRHRCLSVKYPSVRRNGCGQPLRVFCAVLPRFLFKSPMISFSMLIYWMC